MEERTSIIVFSKGRPMQLHAYLESLLKFSDALQRDITVLCCETEGIRYDKVRNNFPEVNWCIESKFEENLKQIVADAGRYIMFGCDDVVFTGNFSLKKATTYLEENPQVFGFSIRLGKNILPYPTAARCTDGVMEWNWEKSKEQHYNYPWELDCTVYRREDVVKLIDEEEKVIKNPNYLEAIINADNKSDKLKRKHMACSEKHGSAVVITVNRVQDSYQNGFDDSMMTDIYSLDHVYNDEGNSMDIDRISQLKNKTVHVGAEYFLLRKPRKGYLSKCLWRKRLKSAEHAVIKFPKKCYNYVERRLYRYGLFEKRLYISDTETSMRRLAKENVSFVRIGKGEIGLMRGETLPEQRYDKHLAERLKEVLQNREKGLLVGVPYYYVYPKRNLLPSVAVYAQSIAPQRRFLLKYSLKARHYIDSGITQAYHIYDEYDFDRHFSMAEKLLKNRNVTVICGEGVWDRLQYNLLDVCDSVEYQYAPSTEAYSQYVRILRRAQTINKERMILVSLGPTAKPLAYDLYQSGYRVWDIGHLLKDYDCYKRKKARTEAEIIQFYMPD